MERTRDVGEKVFDGISKHKAALEAIMNGCILDPAKVQDLEGL